MFAKVKFKANPCHKKFISLHLWNNARVHCKTPAQLLSALEKSSPRHSQAVGQWRCRRHFHSRRCPPRLVVRLLLRRSPQKKSDSRSFREGKRATRNCWEFACWYSDYVSGSCSNIYIYIYIYIYMWEYMLDNTTLLQIIIHWPQRPKAGISEATIHSWSLWYIHLTTIWITCHNLLSPTQSRKSKVLWLKLANDTILLDDLVLNLVFSQPSPKIPEWKHGRDPL